MDLFAQNLYFDNNNCPDFVYDDGGHDYNWSSETIPYLEDKVIKFIEGFNLQLEDKNVSNTLILPDVSNLSLNDEQTFAHNLVLNTLFQFKNDPLNFQPFRLTGAGTAGSGKSFLITCLVKSIIELFMSNKAVQVLCPTGNSANLISGVILHSFLKIPIGLKSSKEMTHPIAAHYQSFKVIVNV